MVNQLKLNTDIVEGPTIRESDGLAMSSRNQLLNSKQRQAAPIIFKTLLEAKQSYGQRPIKAILKPSQIPLILKTTCKSIT